MCLGTETEGECCCKPGRHCAHLQAADHNTGNSREHLLRVPVQVLQSAVLQPAVLQGQCVQPLQPLQRT